MIKQINEIKPDKDQPRKTFDDESLQHLAESILGNGLIIPIDVDEDGIIIDGERRWRAYKLTGLKEIEVRVIKLKKGKVERLRRQLISDLLDDKIPTEESYEAIVKLWKMEKDAKASLEMKDFCKEIGINRTTLRRALNYIQDKQANPKAVEGISPGVWREIRSLPSEEREEIKKELKETDEPFTKIVEQKKEQIKQRKEQERLEEELEEKRKELGKKDFKIQTDRERLFNMQNEIVQMRKDRSRFYADIRWIGKTKFYLNTPKQKDGFINFLDGESQEARRWADELDVLKEKISIEIIRE